MRTIRLEGGRSFGRSRARQVGPVEVERGARGVELRFLRQGGLEVTFEHQPERTCTLYVALFAPSGGRIDPFPVPRAADRGSMYSFGGLEPGRHRFTATLVSEDEPIVDLDDVEIGPGPNTDPRLTAIRLPGVRVLRVDLVGEDGVLRDDVLEGVVLVRDGDAWRGRWCMGARVGVAVREGPVDVAVVVPGFRPVRRFDVRFDLEVPLEPLPSLSLRFEAIGGEAPAGRICVRAIPLDNRNELFRIAGRDGVEREDPAPWLGSVVLAPSATGEVPVDGPGRYRLDVRWQPLAAEPFPVEVTPAIVEVGGRGPVPCTVQIQAAALRR